MDLQQLANTAMNGTPNLQLVAQLANAMAGEGMASDTIVRVIGRFLIAGGLPEYTMDQWSGAIAHVVGNVITASQTVPEAGAGTPP